MTTMSRVLERIWIEPSFSNPDGAWMLKLDCGHITSERDRRGGRNKGVRSSRCICRDCNPNHRRRR